MIQQQIEEVEVTIEQAREAVALRDSLVKLSKNREFKKIIEVGFFENEAVRLVAAKSNPELQRPEQQAVLDKQIIAVGSLNNYFSMIMAIGNQAEMSIAENSQTLEALHAEELDGQEV